MMKLTSGQRHLPATGHICLERESGVETNIKVFYSDLNAPTFFEICINIYLMCNKRDTLPTQQTL